MVSWERGMTHPELNFRLGKGRQTERRKIYSGQNLIDMMRWAGYTDAEIQKALESNLRPDAGPPSETVSQPIESYGTYRPGRSDCECQYDHTDSSRLTDREYGYCGRIGRMHNGMFMCGECWRRVGHRKASFGGTDPFVETVR